MVQKHPPSHTIGLIVEREGQKEPGQHRQLRPQEMLLQRLGHFITGMSYCLVDEVHTWELLALNMGTVSPKSKQSNTSNLNISFFFNEKRAAQVGFEPMAHCL